MVQPESASSARPSWAETNMSSGSIRAQIG